MVHSGGLWSRRWIVAIVLISSGGGESSGYVVRAIFDNGGFMVKGEQVRVAGANVGEIESVGVTCRGRSIATKAARNGRSTARR